MFRNDQGLFSALESVLKAAKEPLTCVQLHEMSSIQKHASTANRVSDYLGNMWRKGLVLRSPAPKITNSSARWAYSWKKQPVQTFSPKAEEFIDNLRSSGKSVYKKDRVEITDNGDSVTIDLPTMTITIKTKR